MSNDDGHRNIVLLRSWLGTASGGEAYAHIEAVIAREIAGRHFARYGDCNIISSGDDGRKTLHLDRFRMTAQIDGRHSESYAWRWGYQPSNGHVFDVNDFRKYGPSIMAIKRALDRFDRDDGPLDRLGRLVARLARALKIDGVAILEISLNGSFHDGLEVRRRMQAGEYGTAIRAIDHLVLELHQACKKRIGQQAA